MVAGPQGRAGACGNFSHLLRHSEGEYLTFCDQDDIWKPEKLAVTLETMHRLEEEYGKHTPLLVHTDLQVVDRDARLVAASFRRHQHLDPEGGGRLNRLLVQNVITGSTAMINAPLRDLCRSIPAGAIMHDWWLALTAAAFGRIAYLPCQTVAYRQHAGNQIGARGWSLSYLCGRMAGYRDLRSSLARTRRQAAAFLEVFGEKMGPRQREMIKAYACLGRENFFLRRIRIFEFNFFKCGLARNFALLLLV